ncbi:MAG: alanine dehydrogenase [Candidatus Neomarinimicrobiota bacterium]|nr:alanine dehydrogenase [Candidatus Neomarinimicrobiota bacterium]
MKIGVPKEIISQEYRVGINPKTAQSLVESSHEVFVESNAGIHSGYNDSDYQQVGCTILNQAVDVFDAAELIVKVKEPSFEEVELLENKTIFTYLHLSSSKELTEKLLHCNTTSIAYETVSIDNELPMLKPMSEIAGRLAILDCLSLLKKSNQGKGKLISGTSLSDPANVIILGAGVVGVNALEISLGLGANTTILDINEERLVAIKETYPKANTAISTSETINKLLPNADIVVGAVLTVGGKPPTLITREMLKSMQPKSILSDVSIDQGGCFETSKATTHDNPTYEVDDIIHYCVRNIPSAVPFTATDALNEATRPYILYLANNGIAGLKENSELRMGLNTHKGHLLNREVAEAHNLNHADLNKIL